MKLYRLRVPKAKLAAMLPEDRTLFLLLGHAANEITVLQKLIIFSCNRDQQTEFERQIEGGQAMLLTRLLIGKLNEGWELIRTRLLSSKSASMKYIPMLNADGQQALELLKRQFGGSNLIAKVRSAYAFHTPNDQDIEVGFKGLGEDEPWVFYMSEVRGNSFYLASDYVVGFAMVSEVDPTNAKASLEAILDAALKAASALADLIDASMEAIISHYQFDEDIELVADMRVPDLSTTTIPFFAEPGSGGTLS